MIVTIDNYILNKIAA